MHPVPLVSKMTLEAVLVNPVQGAQTPGAGTVKFRAMKLVPPLPKPPPTAMQKTGSLWAAPVISAAIPPDSKLVINRFLVIIASPG
jgi:hypothetical protein